MAVDTKRSKLVAQLASLKAQQNSMPSELAKGQLNTEIEQAQKALDDYDRQTNADTQQKVNIAKTKLGFTADDLLFNSMRASSATDIDKLKKQQAALVKEKAGLPKKLHHDTFGPGMTQAEIDSRSAEIDKSLADIDSKLAAYGDVSNQYYSKAKQAPSAKRIEGTEYTGADNTLAQLLGLNIQMMLPTYKLTANDKTMMLNTLQGMSSAQLSQVITSAKDSIIQHSGTVAAEAGTGNYVAKGKSAGSTQAYILAAAQNVLAQKASAVTSNASALSKIANENNLSLNTVDKNNATALGQSGAIAYIAVLNAESTLAPYGNGDKVPAQLQDDYHNAKINYDNAVANYNTYVNEAQSRSDTFNSTAGALNKDTFADTLDRAYYQTLLDSNAYEKDATDTALLQKKLDALPAEEDGSNTGRSKNITGADDKKGGK